MITNLAKIKINFDRGNAYISTIRNLLIIIASLKIIFPSITYTEMVLSGIFTTFIIYFVGWCDTEIIKVFQKEQELLTSVYNPHLNKINRLKG